MDRGHSLDRSGERRGRRRHRADARRVRLRRRHRARSPVDDRRGRRAVVRRDEHGASAAGARRGHAPVRARHARGEGDRERAPARGLRRRPVRRTDGRFVRADPARDRGGARRARQARLAHPSALRVELPSRVRAHRRAARPRSPGGVWRRRLLREVPRVHGRVPPRLVDKLAKRRGERGGPARHT